MERSSRTNFILIAIALILLGAGFIAAAHAQVVGITLPSVPSGVAATAGSAPGQINVSWSASAETSGTIEGYYIYRNGSEITATAGTSYTDAGLQAGYYSYTVAAYDANGDQSQQSSAASVTIIADTTPPSAPSNVSISAVTSTNSYYAHIPVTITWDPSTDNVGVAGYYIYRNGTPITSSTSAFTGTSILDSVQPGTYTYTVTAYDAAQNVSARSTPVTITISIDNAPPSVPTNVVAQQVSANGVNVSWGASMDQDGVAGYQVFRNGTQIATTTGTSFADAGLSTNMQYSYTITAYDVAGNISSASEPPVNITIQPFSGPSAPIVTSVLLLGTSSTRVAWTPSADPLVITGYTIYRDGAAIATVTSTNYIDTGLTAGAHIYNLTATDVSGTVSPSSASSTIIIPTVTTSSATTAPATAPISTPVITTAPPATTVSPSLVSVPSITQSLYYGLRNAQVTALQTVLADNGYVSSAKITGFFGNLTLGALEKFQCNKNIVCTGGAGWGIVGPKTRAALNALESGSSAAPTSVSASAAATTASANSAILAQLQTLEAELASLQAAAGK